jgi:16S rRNA (cytosine1402-N4)-methyltransferase
MTKPHLSVLLEAVVAAFANCSCRYIVDGTLGAGGHARALLESHPEVVKYIGIDQDPLALKIAQQELAPWSDKLQIIHGNFRNMPALLTASGYSSVDAILLDLGVSSMQLDMPEKGFSFMREGPLDMRMDPTNPLTAEEIVNSWSEDQLGRIFREYGEEQQWRAIARTISKSRSEAPLRTTSQLAALLMPLLGWKFSKGKQPMAQVFQALRIAVNDELAIIQQLLPMAIELLNPGGRLAVISFHSLEDRIVKQTFQRAASDKVSDSGLGGLFLSKEPTIKMVTRRPIEPSDDEIEANPRSRSAKLRVVEKL